jgi:methylmalonyl-CoA mutase cobalamin-binding subunit
MERLRASGVKGVFTPGTTLEAIIGWVRENVPAKA